jgi:hypothetical protein
VVVEVVDILMLQRTLSEGPQYEEGVEVVVEEVQRLLMFQ